MADESKTPDQTPDQTASILIAVAPALARLFEEMVKSHSNSVNQENETARALVGKDGVQVNIGDAAWANLMNTIGSIATSANMSSAERAQADQSRNAVEVAKYEAERSANDLQAARFKAEAAASEAAMRASSRV